MTIAASPAAIAREREVARSQERGDLKSARMLCCRLTLEFPHFAPPGWHGARAIALRLDEPANALALIDRALATGLGTLGTS